MTETIQDWKERNLRRVDIEGGSVMVLGEDAKHHLERIRRKLVRIETALHQLEKAHSVIRAILSAGGQDD